MSTSIHREFHICDDCRAGVHIRTNHDGDHSDWVCLTCILRETSGPYSVPWGRLDLEVRRREAEDREPLGDLLATLRGHIQDEIAERGRPAGATAGGRLQTLNMRCALDLVDEIEKRLRPGPPELSGGGPTHPGVLPPFRGDEEDLDADEPRELAWWEPCGRCGFAAIDCSCAV